MVDIRQEVGKDALRAIQDLYDEIVDAILENRGDEISKDIDEYSEEYARERITLGWVQAKQAVEVMDALDEFEVISGIANFDESWRDGLSMLADDTYKNAVVHRFGYLIGELNDALRDAEAEGKLSWSFPPFDTGGVLEWSPDLQRQEEAHERKRQKFEAEFPENMRPKVRKIVEQFVKAQARELGT